MIPFVALDREYDEIRDEITDAVESVLESQWFVLGDEVNQFERHFAEYIGCQHAVGVNSGSDALQIALESLGVGSGDEVILPSHTFVATANAVMKTGANPVFVDIDPDTYCIDPDEVRSAVTEKTAAVIPVHLYGQPADIESIQSICEQNDIAIVEDACQAHGSTYDGQTVGSFGDIGCFSFYPTKNLGAYGDGGAIVTDNDELATRIAEIRNVGQSSKYRHEHVGFNSRLDELQAAVLNVKLERLDDWNRRRSEAAAIYDELLDGVVTTPTTRNNAEHVYHLYVIRTENRDSLREYLDERDIGTLIHYPTPIHEQPAYQEYSDVSLPVTERIAEQIVSLPMHPWIEPDEIERVVRHIEAFESA